MSENEEKLKTRILKRTENAIQRQSVANEELKKQGKSVNESNKNLNELRYERRLGDQDLSHMKRNKNVFKRFLLDYCCCCCCQCCRDCCQDKQNRVRVTTTESEEPDPDEETVNATWTQRYRHKTVDQQIAENLRRLNEDAEETDRELRRQNQLIDKMDSKAKRETKMLDKSSKDMNELIK